MQKITLQKAAIGAVKYVGAQFLPITELAKQRTAICEQCPLFDKAARRCRECGCFVDEKVKYQNEKCPVGRW